MNEKQISFEELCGMIDKWNEERKSPYIRILFRKGYDLNELTGSATFETLRGPDYIKWQSPAYISIEKECTPIDCIKELEYEGCVYKVKQRH